MEWFRQSELYKTLSAWRDTREPNILQHLFRLDDEARLHTPMISWLLDPSGDHGLGAGPLSRFLEVIGVRAEGAAKAEVRRESFDQDMGRADILVDIYNYSFIIENKLGAQDQPSQLWRYWQMLEKSTKNKKCAHIFYLTINGDQPSKDSITSPTGESLSGDEVTCISYRKEVLEWLRGILHSLSDAPLLISTRGILRQYLEVVMKVAGVHDREKALQKLQESGIYNFLNKDPDGIFPLAQAAELAILLHASLLDELVSSIDRALRNDGTLSPASKPSHWKKLDWSICESWARGLKTPGYLAYSISGARYRDMSLVIGFDSDDKVWAGLACLSGKHLPVPSGAKEITDEISNLNLDSYDNDWWACWITVPGIDPASLDGTYGVAKLTLPAHMTDMQESVISICRKLVEAARQGSAGS